MNLGQGNISVDEARQVLAHWEVDTGTLEFRPWGGTANANIRVTADGRDLFLRRRSERYSSEEQVRFDHALMEHLAACNLCTPRAIRTREGPRWLRQNGRVYELYPFMDGCEHDSSSRPEIESAGRHLRAFHDATREWKEPPEKAWPRRNDPKEALRTLEAAGGLVQTDEEAARVESLIERTARLADTFTDDVFWSLPTLVIHGDYHPANLKFRDGEVVGIFDLDWATRQPRMVDIADSLLFFSGVRASPTDPADIFSLTQTFEFDIERMRWFIEAGGAADELSAQETTLLREFLLVRWIYCRADAMRKVPDEDKIRLLLAGIEGPLEWLDAHASVWQELMQ